MAMMMVEIGSEGAFGCGVNFHKRLQSYAAGRSRLALRVDPTLNHGAAILDSDNDFIFKPDFEFLNYERHNITPKWYKILKNSARRWSTDILSVEN